MAAAVVAGLALLLVVTPSPTVAKGQTPQQAALGAAQLALDHLQAQAPGALDAYLLEDAAAAGRDPHAWPTASPLAGRVPPPQFAPDLLPGLRPAYARSVAHLPSVDAAGQPVALAVMHAFDGQQWGNPALLNDDAWSLRVLAALGPLDANATRGAAALADAQAAGGGWSWKRNGTPDVDSTGMILVALHEAGLAAPPQALAFVQSAQSPDGGFATEPGGAANCDSTVWALRAAAAAGQPAPQGAWAYLLGLAHVVPDGVAYAYTTGGGDNALCTAEVAGLLADAGSGRVPLEGWPQPAGTRVDAPGIGLVVALAAVALARRRA